MKKKLLLLDFNLPYLIKDSDYPVGGATIEWFAWLKGFKQNDCEVGVLTWKGAKEYMCKSLDFDIVESYSFDEGIAILRWFYKRYPALFKAVKSYNPDYIIQECAGLQTGIMGLISKRLNLPFIYRVANDMDADDRYKDRLNIIQQIAYRYGLNRADAIFCQNSYQYNKFKKLFSNKKIIVIHNPYYCEQKLTKLKDRTERKYIAWIGIFQHQKNLPALYKIVKSLPSVEFKIAGKTLASLDKDTKKALKDLNLCKNVSSVGYLRRTEIIPFLSSALALINTSHYEGFSNVFLESFAAGTPVITTSRVDPDDIIANNKLGLVAKDYCEIPKLIISLKNSKDYNSMAHRCRDYVMKNHDPKVIAKKFIDSLKKIGY